MIKQYLSRAQQAQQQIDRVQSVDPTEHLIAKLSFLSAENERLQELLQIESTTKERFRQMAESKTQIIGRAIYETEIQSLNDQITILQRNIDLLQTFLVNSNEQMIASNINKYEVELAALKRDLREACQYNVLLLQELRDQEGQQEDKFFERQELQITEQNDASVQADMIDIDTLRNRNEELKAQVDFLKENLRAMRTEQMKLETQQKFVNEQKDLTERSMQLIQKLKEKDETIVALMTAEKKLQNQLQEALLKGSTQSQRVPSGLGMSRKVSKKPINQSEVDAQFSKIIGKNGRQENNDNKSDTSVQNNKSNYVELLQEQLQDKDRYIQHLESQIQPTDGKLVEQISILENDIKILNEQLSQKTLINLKMKSDIEKFQHKFDDLEELEQLREDKINLQKELNQKTAELTQKERQYNEKITYEIALKDLRIHELEENMKQREQMILDLEEQVDRYQAADVQVAILEEEIQALKSELTIKQQMIDQAKYHNHTIQLLQPQPRHRRQSVLEISQKALIPQLLPRRLTVELNPKTYFEFIDLIGDGILPVKILVTVSQQHFYVEVDGANLVVNQQDILQMDFDYKAHSFGCLTIKRRQKDEVRFGGMDVGSLYACLAYRFN